MLWYYTTNTGFFYVDSGNERLLPNTNGQWDLLSKDLLHIIYNLTSEDDATFIQMVVCIPGISYNFDMSDLMEC